MKHVVHLHLGISMLFVFCSGAPLITVLTAGALTDLQLPAAASNATTGARLGGVGRVPPPNKNPGYADAPSTNYIDS